MWYKCPICGRIEARNGLSSQNGSKIGICIHGEILVFMKRW